MMSNLAVSLQTMRKIIHIDMDCFYAAVEIRDNPNLADKAVAVGGNSERGVLCTCNYIARKFGVRSAMSNKIALTKCKNLIILPVNMTKYKAVAKEIHAIFHQFTDLVEPLALDEAYLDVTENQNFNNSATLIAEEIRKQIYQKLNLTASAGVAPNKFLAKIASGWNKPNGIFVIPPDSVSNFIIKLPVEKLFGVGNVTLKKLHQMNIKTCADAQKHTLYELIQKFGKFGQMLYYQSRGIDNRIVQPNRVRKSLSVETTFITDITSQDEIQDKLIVLYQDLCQRLQNYSQYKIKTLYLKLKYADFKRKTCETSAKTPELNIYRNLLNNSFNHKAIRLLGIGVRFEQFEQEINDNQLSLFNDACREL